MASSKGRGKLPVIFRFEQGVVSTSTERFVTLSANRGASARAAGAGAVTGTGAGQSSGGGAYQSKWKSKGKTKRKGRGHDDPTAPKSPKRHHKTHRTHLSPTGTRKPRHTTSTTSTTTSASSTHTVKAFLSRRVKKGTEQWKVHWKGYLASESSWEPAHTLRNDLGAAMFDVCVRGFEDLQLGRVILPWKDKDWATVRTDLEVFYEGEGTESQDDGAWHECVLLRHHRQNHVVLWYGGEEFEGLDVSIPGVVGSSGYTWNKGVLRDNSGKVIKTRKQKKLDVRRRLC